MTFIDVYTTLQTRRHQPTAVSPSALAVKPSDFSCSPPLWLASGMSDTFSSAPSANMCLPSIGPRDQSGGVASRPTADVTSVAVALFELPPCRTVPRAPRDDQKRGRCYRIVGRGAVEPLCTEVVDDRPLTYALNLLSLRRGTAPSCSAAGIGPRDSLATASSWPVTGIACSTS